MITIAKLAGLLFLVSAPAFAEAGPLHLQCLIGPVSRQFGGTDWIVYSCDDGRSLVVLSTAKNPATPFYFFLTPRAGDYHISGEGTGNKQASDAANEELSHLSAADIAKLLADTRHGANPKH